MFNIVSFANTLFTGLSIFVPLLVLIKFSKAFNTRLNVDTLILATNWLLLGAGIISIIFEVSIIVQSLIGYYSQTEFNQYTILNRLTGPYGFVYVSYLIIYELLPLLICFKKIRQSIATTIIWASIDYLLSALRFYSANYNNFRPSTHLDYLSFFSSQLMSLLVFSAFLVIIYFFLLTQQKRSLSKHRAKLN